jgi:outer membrane protein assembly factor BamD
MIASASFPFRRLFLAALAVAGLALAGCSSDDKDKYVERPVDELYNDGLDAMNQGDLKKASDLFDEVDRQHPYSVWATRAQLMSAYAYYQADKYDEAISGLDNFIQLHPGNPDAAYAYYLKALCYYEQIADVERDQQDTQQALDALQEVVARYPDSDYAKDARLKIDLARDHLAGKEMEVGRYYQKRGYYLAAINRYRKVVEDYQVTTQTPEALERLTECYLALGVKDEAQTAAAVLGYNYPGSTWYQASFDLLKGKNLKPEKSSSSWLSDF